MRTISLDTETFLIGPGAIAPKMVCFTTAERCPKTGAIETDLVGNGDADCEVRLSEPFQAAADGEVRLVLHNAAFDLTVIATSYPDLEPVIWAAVEQGNVTDTKIREQLLNLSTHGHIDSMFLPDGSAQKLSYSLATLTLKYLGIDVSSLKQGDDIWRLRYNELDGYRAEQYPRDAADYALGDAQHTLQVYEEQERGKEVEGSTETEFFQTASDFALRWITIAGMKTDPEKFEEIRAMLADELSEDKLAPLVEAGVMRARAPARPHARQRKKALAFLKEWTGRDDLTPDEIECWRDELEGAGLKFKDEEKSGIKKKPLLHRVMAAHLSLAFGDSVDNYLGMELEEQVALADGADVAYKKTDKGHVCADSEVIEDVAPADDVLRVYQHRQKLQKLVSTEIPRMMWEGKLAETVHFPYRVLLETGRTSSSADKLFPSGNGQQIDPRARPMFVPRGVFCSTDYSTLELGHVGQTMLDLFGYSKHAEKINAGYDLHAYLGTQLAIKFSPEFRVWLGQAGIPIENADDCYEFFRMLETEDLEFYEHWRKFAKPIGLGFPGGLGPYKMLSLAKKTYKVDIVGEAEKMFDEHPEMFDRSSFAVRYWAAKLYGWKKDNDQWTPTLKGVALAKMLRDIWLNTYPEMREYFDSFKGDKKRKVFDEEGNLIEQDDSESSKFDYTSPFGMTRAACTFTSAANGKAMQTPAAEGFKAAVFNLVKECRIGALKGRAIVVNEIHDETITDILDVENAHEVAMAIREVMEESMRLVLREVAVKAEPCLMRRWLKKAKPRFDDAGHLIPWEPDEAVAT